MKIVGELKEASPDVAPPASDPIEPVLPSAPQSPDLDVLPPPDETPEEGVDEPAPLPGEEQKHPESSQLDAKEPRSVEDASVLAPETEGSTVTIRLRLESRREPEPVTLNLITTPESDRADQLSRGNAPERIAPRGAT